MDDIVCSITHTNFFSCLSDVLKRLQTLKHSIKVFNERLVDVCTDSSECEKRFHVAGQLWNYQLLIFKYKSKKISNNLLTSIKFKF